MAMYDVVVIGGGTAGTIAAIQAGRAGARTLLVEKNGMLGGTMTVGGINAPASFFAWGKPITGGIAWELVRKTLEETGQPVPTADVSANDSGPKSVHIDRTVFAALCDEAVLQAGVELLLHTMPATAAFSADQWTLALCTKSGLREIRSKVLIDATGDANVVEMAGFEVERPETVQPATLPMHCSGYDPQKLDWTALKAASEAAIAQGTLKTTDISWWRDQGPQDFLNRRGHNANHLRAPGAETSEGRTAAEVEARRSALRTIRFFRKQPGLENFRVEWTAPEVGIRETVRIRGKATVLVADYEAGKGYDDAICYAFYSVDEHLNDGMGINYRLLQPNIVPTIPRGALLPAGSRFLIVAGRCLSSDRESHSGLRVECPCMAMGQAAGAMAAISARTGLDPGEIPLGDLHDLLRRHGAIVPDIPG